MCRFMAIGVVVALSATAMAYQYEISGYPPSCAAVSSGATCSVKTGRARKTQGIATLDARFRTALASASSPIGTTETWIRVPRGTLTCPDDARRLAATPQHLMRTVFPTKAARRQSARTRRMPGDSTTCMAAYGKFALTGMRRMMPSRSTRGPSTSTPQTTFRRSPARRARVASGVAVDGAASTPCAIRVHDIILPGELPMRQSDSACGALPRRNRELY